MQTREEPKLTIVSILLMQILINKLKKQNSEQQIKIHLKIMENTSENKLEENTKITRQE
jgi:hypothetical protein